MKVSSKTELQDSRRLTVGKVLSNYGIFIAFIILCITLAFLAPGKFFTIQNILNIAKQISIVGLLATALTLVLIMGEIDISFAGLTTLCGIAVATWQGSALIQGIEGKVGFTMPPSLAIFLTLLLGLSGGFIVGTIVTRVRVTALLVTLGAGAIYEGFALFWSKARAITGLKDSFKVLGQGYSFGVPNLVWIFIVFVIIITFIAKKTKFGRHVYAIGGNIQTAYLSGVPVTRVRTIVFGILGFTAALGGILLTSRLNSATPEPQPTYMLDAIAACVIGGTSLAGGVGNPARTVIGVLFLGVIYNGLTLLGVPVALQYIIKGAIIIGAIILDSMKQRVEGGYVKE